MIRLERVISARLTKSEFEALWKMARRLKLTRQELLRAIIIDALVEEGYDALRCEQSKGRETVEETCKAGGTTAP